MARGFTQRKGIKGIDYVETYAPTPTDKSSRIIDCVALAYKYELRTNDFSQAFLNAHNPADKPIYMKIPQCLEAHYTTEIESVRAQGKYPVAQLIKALYGCKSSSYLWLVDTLTKVLINECMYDQSSYNPCL